jgi:hypothetical protein
LTKCKAKQARVGFMGSRSTMVFLCTSNMILSLYSSNVVFRFLFCKVKLVFFETAVLTPFVVISKSMHTV